MNLEDIMLNEMSDTKGEILYGSPYMIGNSWRQKVEVARGQEEGNGKLLFTGCLEVPFGMMKMFWRWIVVMVVKHYGPTINAVDLYM